LAPRPDPDDSAAPQAPGGGVPRVSVVIPFLNAAATLTRAMDSVAAQTFTDWEAILVDDGSDDGSAELVAERARSDPRFRLIRLPRNTGVSGARNAGLEVVRGRFIAFLDADDRWLPDKLALQVPRLEAGASLVCAGYRRVNPHGISLGVTRPPAQFSYRDALGGNPVGCLTAMWDSHRFPNARMPPLPLHEDYAFWLSLLRNGAEGVGLPQILAEYTVRRHSRSGRKWRAAWATWTVLRSEPDITLAQAALGFMKYGLRSTLRAVVRRLGR